MFPAVGATFKVWRFATLLVALNITILDTFTTPWTTNLHFRNKLNNWITVFNF